MYITAHRVTHNGSEHVNAFVHEHGSSYSWPADPSELPENDPGREREELRYVEVAPGGNRVRSYLDVLMPDDTAWNAIDVALDALGRDIDQRLNPVIFTCGGVIVRFGVDFGLTSERRAEFERLRGYVGERWQAWAGRAVAA